MDPIIVLLVGMVIVIAGVLLLRLHAFLALGAGALAVAFLTPSQAVFQTELQSHSAMVVTVLNQQEVELKLARGVWVSPGTYQLYRSVNHEMQAVGQINVTAVSEKSVASIANATVAVEQNDRLVHQRDVVMAQKRSQRSVGSRIAMGFGETCGKIGILIAMASIIGRCLLASGAAEKIVLSVRDAFGDRRTPVAFSVSGFVVGIPVFFDTVFYLLMPLARAMWMKTRCNYLLYVLSIVVGATMAHSLVPPTPGPLFVAGELNVNLGLMILAGCAVGMVAVSVGYLYAVWANRRWDLPMRDLSSSDLEQQQVDRSRPPLFLAMLPILIPIVLLSAKTICDMTLPASHESTWVTTIVSVVNFWGDKNLALALAAAFALMMLVRYPDPSLTVSSEVQEALLSAGNIVLITAAGGAFGHVLRQTGIAPAIENRFPVAEGGIALLLVAFGITSLVRIAQGSATVAMITSVGIVAPIVANVELAFNPVYVALAIGCGSKPIPWMNDSGFWVVTRMTGMSEGEALRTVSVALTLMGLVGLAVTLVGAVLLPLN